MGGRDLHLGRGSASGVVVCIQDKGVGQIPPDTARIRSTSGRYTSYWNAFLLILPLGVLHIFNIEGQSTQLNWTAVTIGTLSLT